MARLSQIRANAARNVAGSTNKTDVAAREILAKCSTVLNMDDDPDVDTAPNVLIIKARSEFDRIPRAYGTAINILNAKRGGPRFERETTKDDNGVSVAYIWRTSDGDKRPAQPRNS